MGVRPPLPAPFQRHIPLARLKAFFPIKIPLCFNKYADLVTVGSENNLFHVLAELNFGSRNVDLGQLPDVRNRGHHKIGTIPGSRTKFKHDGASFNGIRAEPSKLWMPVRVRQRHPRFWGCGPTD